LFPVLVTLGLTLLFCSSMLVHPSGLRQGDDYRDEDWLHDLSFSFTLREGLKTHGELPLRSHLVGGGYPILGHPSDGTLSPFSLPFVALSPAVAVRLNLVVLLWIGTLGIYGLGRSQLRLGRVGATLAAAAFAFSGWFPSMMLAGFYVQAFYLLTPAALYLLARPGPGLRPALAAGLLLVPILLQGGTALAAIVHFLAVAVVLLVAGRSGSRAKLWETAALVVTVSLIFALRPMVGGIACTGLLIGLCIAAWRWAPLRELLACLRPGLLRLAMALAVLLAVGAAKWLAVAEVVAAGEDFHSEAVGKDHEYPFASEEDAFRCFYGSIPSFISHLHRPLAKTTTYSDPYSPDVEEYAPLGLTLPIALVALVALALALVRGAPFLVPWALLWLGYLAVCMGPTLPFDAYWASIWSLPGFFVITDPYKYFNFFLLLPLVLAFGASAERLGQRFGRPLVVTFVAALLLSWPLALNSPLFAHLLKQPVESREPAESFHQVALVPPTEHADFPHPEMYREFFRPNAVREFFTIPRGVGVVNWYADIYLPETAVARFTVDRDGVTRPNEAYRGELWCAPEPCTIERSSFTFNTVTAQVLHEGPVRLAVNQNYDPRFVPSVGTLVEEGGQLAVDLPGSGTTSVTLRYRPLGLIIALWFSALSLLLVLWLLWRLRGADLLPALAVPVTPILARPLEAEPSAGGEEAPTSTATGPAEPGSPT
jgi:hypothetical protein